MFTARSEVLQRHVQYQAHISDLRGGQIFQNRDEIHKLVVMSVGEPRWDRHGVLRVEDVWCGWVVNDDGLAKWAANLAQVLDVVALVVVAWLAEEAVVYRIRDVQLIEERVAVFWYRGGEHNDLVDFANALEESIDTGALDYVDVVVLTFDLDRDSEVGLVKDL